MMSKKCSDCNEIIPSTADHKDDEKGGFRCYRCHISGISFGRVAYGTGVTDSVRSERDLHKRMAEEAGHEWVPMS